MATAAALNLGEALHLLAPWLARALTNAQEAALVIKGPTLSTYGLRREKESSDVDLLCGPAHFEEVQHRLEKLGWAPRMDDATQDEAPEARVTLHSATLQHDAWPIEIDLHYYFPGMLTDPQVAFDGLWERRVTMPMAGQEIVTTDLLGSAVIAGLHYLRHPETPYEQERLADLVERLDGLLDVDRRRELAELALQVGAQDSLGPLLDAIGAPRIGAGTTEPDRWRDWQLQTSAVATGTLWITELRRTPVRRWPRTLRHALWPSEAMLQATRFKNPMTPEEMRRTRIERLKRAARELPEAVRTVRRLRREEGAKEPRD